MRDLLDFRFVRHLLQLLLLPGDGVGDVRLHAADIGADIAVVQHIIHRFHHPRRGFHAQRWELYGHGVAQRNTFQQRQALIPGILLQVDPAHRDAHVRHADVVVADVLLHPLRQLRRARLFLKIAGKIHRDDAVEIIGAGRVHDASLYKRPVAACPVADHAGGKVGNVFILLDVG